MDLDTFADDELSTAVVRREADGPAANNAAGLALELRGEVGLPAAVVAQIGQVHAGLLAGEVDDRRQHRW